MYVRVSVILTSSNSSYQIVDLRYYVRNISTAVIQEILNSDVGGYFLIIIKTFVLI